MSEAEAITMVRETLQLVLLLSAPILFSALVVGLIVGVLQAMTQVQEQTLSFVPKILAMGLVTILALPWLFEQIAEFSTRLFGTMG